MAVSASLALSADLRTGPIRAGTPAFRRTNRALFLGGFSTFALLYCVQPLMPFFAHEFGLSPVQSSWTLSISSALLAACLLFAGALSDRLGRKKIMCLSLASSALLTMACALADSYAHLLALRAVLGIALAGLAALAMAYLSEEIEPASLGYSIGLYIGGSAFGGMMGRVAISALSEHLSWRAALAIVGFAALLAAAEFWRSLPPSRNFKRKESHPASMQQSILGHFATSGLPWFYCLAFLLMGSQVSVYNYIGFRLLEPRFGLRPSTVGAIFLLYLIGIVSSVWAGRLADRFGRRSVLWLFIAVMLAGLLLTLPDVLTAVVAGMALMTFGFFGAHSITSSWVGLRAKPPQALASGLYLFFYYLGASAIGSFSGVLWGRAGWSGVVGLLAIFLTAALAIALRLRALPEMTPRPSGRPLRFRTR